MQHTDIWEISEVRYEVRERRQKLSLFKLHFVLQVSVIRGVLPQTDVNPNDLFTCFPKPKNDCWYKLIKTFDSRKLGKTWITSKLFQPSLTSLSYPPSNVPEYMWERSADMVPFSLTTMKSSEKAAALGFKCRRKVLRKKKHKRLTDVVKAL